MDSKFKPGDYLRDYDTEEEFTIIAITTDGDYVAQRPTVRIDRDHGYNPVSIEQKDEVDHYFEKVEFVNA